MYEAVGDDHQRIPIALGLSHSPFNIPTKTLMPAHHPEKNEKKEPFNFTEAQLRSLTWLKAQNRKNVNILLVAEFIVCSL